ncbi:MAG: hypothetical protein Q7U04_04615 [Bacteriovorax sp.]|nr:hypothetical protein [Bacteriovorax sp.]
MKKPTNNIFLKLSFGPRTKGTIGFIILSTAVLLTYQNCGKKKEIQIVTTQALTAAPLNVAVESALLDQCTNGGITLITYMDKNINGKLDEDELVLKSQNVCNGATGSAGATGATGSGSGLIVTKAPAGSCPSGGIQVKSYIDENNNGVLDLLEKVTSTSSVCNGINGSNGDSAQITMTPATAAQCPNGGSVFTTSTDSTPNESTLICNGTNGTSANISSSLASPSQCPTGGRVISTSNGTSDPIYSVICNGTNGKNAFITTTMAGPYQCPTSGGIVIATWTDGTSPETQIICNGVSATNASITTTAANPNQCPSGGYVITTSTDKSAPVSSIICNGQAGTNGTPGATYLTGIVGPAVTGKPYSACHHDFMYLPSTSAGTAGWLIFRHQKNGTADQGVGTTGFNVWNTDIADFLLVAEVGSTTYCTLHYDPIKLTLSYTVNDKADGLDGKKGTISLKSENH